MKDKSIYTTAAGKSFSRMLMIFLMAFVCQITYAQGKSISGIVKDATAEAVLGATVIEKGKTNGTTTDFAGRFALNIQPNATHTFSYIGYIAQEITVKNK